MWSFLFGLLLGIGAKAVYDLFKEEQLPIDSGLNTSRLETLLDDTRQSVRELRAEVQRALAGEGSLQEKAGRLMSAAGETMRGGGSADRGPDDPGLRLTSDEPAPAEPATQAGGGAHGQGRGGSSSAQGGGSAVPPPATHGTIQTMS